MYLDIFLARLKKLIPKKLFKFLQPPYHFFMSWLASVVYGRPSEKLIIIGITGTTGKTTSLYLIAKVLEEAGYKTGFTSTAFFNDGMKEWLNDKKMTMVGRFFTQKILKTMVKNGCRYAIIETTSEGIRQFRHRFINYDILIFTGLYPEHIESHGSFENYKQAKARLFDHLKNCATKYADKNKKIVKSDSGIKKIELDRVKKIIIANGEDEHAEYFLDFLSDEKVAYLKAKSKKQLDMKVRVHRYGQMTVGRNGTTFFLQDMEIKLQLLGGFNVVNAMSAASIALTQGIRLPIVKEALEKIRGVAGRLEKIDEGQNFTVIVDYAFEPKALANLYETTKIIPHEKIIHVLGSAGGGRDIARRPIIGKLAGEKSDFVIITNEDPYDDDPEVIIQQVAYGAESAGKKLNQDLFKITDRRDAIKKAFSLAGPGDLVLITGKGSEQAICMANGDKISWDDRIIARELIKEILE